MVPTDVRIHGRRRLVALAETTAAVAAAAGGGLPAVRSAGVAPLGAIAAAQLRRGVAQRLIGLAGVASAAGATATGSQLCDLAAAVGAALDDDALVDAARAEQAHSSPTTPRGQVVLTSCRAMFRP